MVYTCIYRMTVSGTFIDALRPEIRTLPAYNSGLSAERVRARYNVAEVAKLGSNENPWGASPRVIAAITEAAQDSALYPDPGSDALRDLLAAKLGVAPDRLAFGNGSEDLISVCAHSFLAPGDEMITILPSFGLHVIYSQAIGAKVRLIPSSNDYSIDISGIIAALTPRTRLVMFSAPSNPLGTTITGDDMDRLLHALGTETLLVFDEAYFEYAAAEDSYPGFLAMLERSGRTWILLRTFSKAYALAGLRVGYGIASDASLIDVIDRARTPFNVNRMAQAGAVAALEETDYVRDCVTRTVAERVRMRNALAQMGYSSSPSVANFLFFDAREDASSLAERLLPYGVIVKPWREPGYREHVRVSIGSPRPNDLFLTALAAAAAPR
jgi:histidinol-phosphate aminotransferase